MKSFRMPWEGHKLQFRAEAFNAFNHVNFYDPVLDINSTTPRSSRRITVRPNLPESCRVA